MRDGQVELLKRERRAATLRYPRRSQCTWEGALAELEQVSVGVGRTGAARRTSTLVGVSATVRLATAYSLRSCNASMVGRAWHGRMSGELQERAPRWPLAMALLGGGALACVRRRPHALR